MQCCSMPPQAKLEEKMQIVTQLSEICVNEAGAVFQCDRRNRLFVNFAGTTAMLKVETFLRLKQAVDSIDLEAMAASTARSSDVEVVSVCGCDKCYVLTLPELVAFRALLGEARFTLELNSMLHECLNAQLA